MNTESLLIVIPARYASTRFPGKPLADICGKPMIQHVYERCRRACPGARIIVGTDDIRIESAVRTFGGEAVMTPTTLATGSERVAWVARHLQADVVVNVQGDEPLLEATTVFAALQALDRSPDIDIGTAACTLPSMDEAMRPDTVKVVLDACGRALYFSRSLIPYPREGSPALPGPWLQHIGIYAYRRDALFRFAALPGGQLEEFEKLEQLRALEHGMHIGVGLAVAASQSVDTPADLARVVAMLE